MEGTADNTNINTYSYSYRKNRIQVSNPKSISFVYVQERYMQLHNEVELSALGMGTMFIYFYNLFKSFGFLIFVNFIRILGLIDYNFLRGIDKRGHVVVVQTPYEGAEECCKIIFAGLHQYIHK